jgi:Mn2+/Fe2+ NRAMP family transporter
MTAVNANQNQPTGQKPATNSNLQIEQERQLLLSARSKGTWATVKTYIRLSGPGWLQSGITLGGGSLASSLYLGVLVGFSFLWLQPLAMILGIIMLSAIAYVTLSTGRSPFRGINEHVSPVLGWSWLLASMMANMVWSLPQFSLGTAALRQNLLPKLIGPGAMSDMSGKMIADGAVLAVCVIVMLTYVFGSRGVKIFEVVIKVMVSIIVLCFFGVVIKLSVAGQLNWGEILRGLIPDLKLFSNPSAKLMPHIEQVAEQFQPFWTNMIVGQQRDVMISSVATAVGINMTFLLPYSMLRKGWDKAFRGLAIFDLSTGLFIPFVIATGCVVIASSSQFHAAPAMGFVAAEPGGEITETPAANLVGPYKSLLKSRLSHEIGAEEFGKLSDEQIAEQIEKLPWADKNMAAILVKRDSFNLADTLSPLTGESVAQIIFGLGVLGMAVSTATILMTINGLCFCELVNRPGKLWPQLVGSLMVCVGALGPFFWKDAQAYLAVPTSMFGMTLLPIAYFAFFLLMNQKSFLGDNIPKGAKRLLWNVLMAMASLAAAFGCFWSVWSTLRWRGIGLLVGFVVLCIVVYFIKKRDKKPA